MASKSAEHQILLTIKFNKTNQTECKYCTKSKKVTVALAAQNFEILVKLLSDLQKVTGAIAETLSDTFGKLLGSNESCYNESTSIN